MRVLALLLLSALCLGGCDRAWNNPYPSKDDGQSVLYLPFSEDPKHFDPAVAYSSDEADVIDNIYVPPLQYHYLKRPYALVPFAARSMPSIVHLDRSGRPLPDQRGGEAAFTRYTITLRDDMEYHPHPAFAIDGDGNHLYHDLKESDMRGKKSLFDFSRTGTRKVVAEDYVYQIKRLADPRLSSPIFGLLGQYIEGLAELHSRLRDMVKGEINLRREMLAGAQAVGDHVLEITVKGNYPQFRYWLAQHFFAPIPWEADAFYRQEPLIDRDITLDRHPVGSGPYQLAEYQSNRKMVLLRNPNYMSEFYPDDGSEDTLGEIQSDAGKRLPFIDKVVFIRETESIPYWNKFLQGYYDLSGISSDNFHEVVSFGPEGVELGEGMRRRGLFLKTSVSPSVVYLGFNMADPVVGGYSFKRQKLRQALAIAVDFGEYIRIFRNDRGMEAHGPIPPSISGGDVHERDYNNFIFEISDGEITRRGIDAAKELLAEAGYRDGRDQKTGKPLVLNFDSTLSGPSAKPIIDWLSRQFGKVGVQLNFRTTDYSRFREKMRKGSSQLYIWGWNADYPDPENFLFLFHGPQSKALSDGENTSNYQNPKFDRLFENLNRVTGDGQRRRMISDMVDILREDTPWIWGYHPIDFSLSHEWVSNVLPSPVFSNTLKYRKVDNELRTRRRAEWNRPVLWPLALLVLVLAFLYVLGVRHYRARDLQVVYTERRRK